MARLHKIDPEPDPQPVGQLLWYPDSDITEVAHCTLYLSAEGPTIVCDSGSVPAKLQQWLDGEHRTLLLGRPVFATSLLVALLLLF